jgi:Tol biopolymer transport system component
VNGAPPTFLADGVDTAWSPNGDRIAIAENVPSTSQLKILDVGSGEEKLLLEVPQDRTVAGIHPEWSPTSELIAFTIEELTSDGQYRISVAYLFDLSKPVPRRMFPVTEVYARDLSWFPDGKWLVVMARTSPGGDVYLAPSEGECIKLLLPEEINGSYVDVSPDGDRLVIVSGGVAFLVDLRAATAEGVVRYPLSCP